MSLRATAWAWATTCAPTAKFVLLALADRADEIGLCWPSVATLVEKTGLSERSVRANLAALEAEGLVRIERGDGRGHTSRYRLAITGTRAKGAPPAPKGTPKGEATAPNTPAERVQNLQERVQHVPKRVHVVPERVQQVHPRQSRTVIDGKETKKGAISLPEWLPQDAWAEWCRHKGRKWGEGIGPKKALNLLSQYRDQGHDPRDVIDHSLAQGWAGLFPSKRAAKPASKLDWIFNDPIFGDADGTPDRDGGGLGALPSPASRRCS